MKLCKLSILLLCLYINVTAVAQDSIITDTARVIIDWKSNFKQQAEQYINNSNICQTSQAAIYFYDLTNEEPLLEYGSRQMMRPASVMKTITAATALHKLGTNYEYQTKLYITGEVKDSILHGDIYIVAGFDPRFGGTDMLTFCEALLAKGIYGIDGNVYTDVSFKDTNTMGYGWLWHWNKDEKPLTPLLYNSNDCFIDKFFSILDVNGISHPFSYSNAVLPASCTEPIAVCKHNIDEILMQMLKKSDNLYAESMFYQLGALDKVNYATFENSAKYVKNFISSELGEDASIYSVADGSGLSVYDYVSPTLLIKLLRYIYKHQNIYNHFYPALPIGGEDGTLASRMKSPQLKGNVHAKTGTVRRVISLAGYITGPDNHEIAFAIFHNGIGVNQGSSVRKWDDALLELLMNSNKTETKEEEIMN